MQNEPSGRFRVVDDAELAMRYSQVVITGESHLYHVASSALHARRRQATPFMARVSLRHRWRRRFMPLHVLITSSLLREQGTYSDDAIAAAGASSNTSAMRASAIWLSEA